MFKTIIKEMQQKTLGHLTVVCARPGDGRRTFTIEFANHLAMQGIPVCFCTISRTKKELENKLLPCIHILSSFSQDISLVLKRLTESVCTLGTVVLIDELSSLVIQQGLRATSFRTHERSKKKTGLLLKIKKIAIQQQLHIVATDTFLHSNDTDKTLPISKDALKLCDKAYILYKENITTDAFCKADATIFKLKEIET